MVDPELYGGSWYAATAVAAPERPSLTIDLDVDLCVIGGGLAGLTVAREVARRGWSVVVLESERVGWAASGRNCGFVIPGFASSLESIVDRVGAETAKALWDLSVEGLTYVRDTIAEAAMPGVAPVDGWLDVSKQDDGDDLIRRVRLLDSVGAEIEGWPIDRVRDTLRSHRYYHAIHYPRAFHLHPLNYVLGLAASAEAAGVRIFEETPALSIDPAGVRKRITTPSARLRAGRVVLAGNVHLGGLMPRLAGTVLPLTTYVAVTAPLGSALGEAVRYTGAVSDSDWADNHYRIVGGDRLMWSGLVTAWAGRPQRRAKPLARAVKRIYPQLGDVPIDHVWRGTLGRTVHQMPQIGELQPGLWVASGFGGHGLNGTALAGLLISRGIVDGDASWRLFHGYELIWAGGFSGGVVAQLAYWLSRARERLAEERLRRRDVLRRREQALADAAEDAEAEPDAAATPSASRG